MSADNGIYILPSPTPNGLEYRVAHAQAIENVDYDPMYEVLLFSKAPVYASEQEAVLAAFEKAKDYDVLEYGVAMLEPRDAPFSSQTYEQACQTLFGR